MRVRFILFVLILLLNLCYSQYEDVSPIHANEYGAGITLSMSGFGLGGFYRIAYTKFLHLGANLDFYMLRDDKEIQFYDPSGYYYEVNNFNRFFMIPLNIEIKKRIFQNSIEENFRPYFTSSAGVAFGMNFPNRSVINYNLIPPEEADKYPRNNQFNFAYCFAIGFGVDFTTSENFFLTIRPQYRFNYFPKIIAGKKDHSSFEIRLELGARRVSRNKMN
jgi:hypothetical protein